MGKLTSKLRKPLYGCLTAALLLGSADAGSAQTSSRAQTANEVIRSLAPIAGQMQRAPSTPRSVPYIDGQGRRTSVALDYRYAIDMTVFFRYNSAELTEAARNQLKPLGQALRSPRLRAYRYMIAGHTDAVGSAEFNRELSFRRADAVARHLVVKYGIDPNRLVVIGWGSTQLKRPRDPEHASNRRVEVVMVDDGAIAPSAGTHVPPPSSAPPGGRPVVIVPPAGSQTTITVEGQGDGQGPTSRPVGSACPADGMRGGSGPIDDFTECQALPGKPGARTIINWQ